MHDKNQHYLNTLISRSFEKIRRYIKVMDMNSHFSTSSLFKRLSSGEIRCGMSVIARISILVIVI